MGVSGGGRAMWAGVGRGSRCRHHRVPFSLIHLPLSLNTLLSDPPAAVTERPSLRYTSRCRRVSCRWLEGRWVMELVTVPSRRRRCGTMVHGRGDGGCGRWRWGDNGGQIGKGGSEQMRWGEAVMGRYDAVEEVGGCSQTLLHREGIGSGAEEDARHESSGERRRRRLWEVEVKRWRRVDGERRRRANALGRRRRGDAALLGEVGDYDQTLPHGKGIGGDTEEEEEAQHGGSG